MENTLAERDDAPLNNQASRLRVIEKNGEVLALAALQTWATGGPSQLQTVGGLVTQIHTRSNYNFFGFMEFNPKSAKRDAGKLRVSIETLKAWSEGQRDILTTQRLDTFHMEGTSTVHDGFVTATTHEYVDLVVCSIGGKHTLQEPPLETQKIPTAPKPKKRLTKKEKEKRKRDRKKKDKSKKQNRK